LKVRTLIQLHSQLQLTKIFKNSLYGRPAYAGLFIGIKGW
jgi:hypothetical protein